MADSTEFPPLLTRTQAAQFLKSRGLPITKRYFEKLSVPSGGRGRASTDGSAIARSIGLRTCSLGPKAVASPATR
jgi:hypothetical protein